MEQRQKYRDLDMCEVIDKDTAQLKYDGIWCLAHVEGDKITYWSRNNTVKKVESNYCKQPDGKYIGELMFGSEWAQDLRRKGLFYVFDCIELDGLDIRDTPYHNRYQCFAVAPLSWRRVQNYQLGEAPALWDHFVMKLGYEGLVYRNSNSPWSETVARQKASFTVDLKILGVVEGNGRLSGTTGKIIASRMGSDSSMPPLKILIGGGLSDSLRATLWSSIALFRGSIIEVECKRIFASGKLRHPNFVRFHPDKNPADFIEKYGTLK